MSAAGGLVIEVARQEITDNTRRALYNLTPVLAALVFVALVIAITLRSPSAGQAKPIPHQPITVSVPSPEAGPAVVTPAIQPRPRGAALR